MRWAAAMWFGWLDICGWTGVPNKMAGWVHMLGWTHLINLYCWQTSAHIGSLGRNLPPSPINNIIQNICFGLSSHVSCSFVWCPPPPPIPISSVWFHYDQRHGCSRKQTLLPVVSIGELRGESELMRVCLNFKLRLRISALIALSLCLFFRLSCLNDVNGSRAIELFIESPPSHQNHMVQSRGTMTTSREESAWIETVNIYERASCHIMSLPRNMLRMSCARSHHLHKFSRHSFIH